MTGDKPRTWRDYETEIVWVRDPGPIPYLREYSIHTRKRTGLPNRHRSDYIVYGYSNVADDAPTDGAGCVRRRLFALKHGDKGSQQYDDGLWEDRAPREAVKIEDIQVRRPSPRLNP